jgi:hypothetical protein
MNNINEITTIFMMLLEEEEHEEMIQLDLMEEAILEAYEELEQDDLEETPTSGDDKSDGVCLEE